MTIGSVKGAPGVTTLGLLAAAELARRARQGDHDVLLAECDPSGGDLALRLGLKSVPGIATLALAARRGLTTDLLSEHTQAVPGAPGVRLLAGIAGPEQGRALEWLLEELAGMLAAAARPAVLDTGRLRLDLGASPLVGRLGAASLLVTRGDAGSVLHARSAAETLRRLGAPCELVAIGREPFAPAEVARAAGLPLAGWLPDDDASVRALLPSAGGGTGAALGDGPRRAHSASPARRRQRVARDQVAALVDGLAGRLGLGRTTRAYAWPKGAAI